MNEPAPQVLPLGLETLNVGSSLVDPRPDALYQMF